MLSIIIPAYNEERRIGKTLRDFIGFFDRKGLTYELIIVMDGCTDRTPDIVRGFAEKKRNIRFVISNERQGKGGALLKGFAVARGDFVAYTDADGSTPPGEILSLLKRIGDCDGIIGSRWMKGSCVAAKQTLMRRIASRGFNVLVRLVFGLDYKDTQCPAKLFKGKVVRDVADKLEVTNFAIDACILYVIKRMGYRVKEVPIRWVDKPMSTLKIGRAVPNMFFTVIKLRLKG
ncbi:MAG: glycosyltransferase family 2 protein [Candidatus Aenigmarchaeota archaeon]|nr:glycosyltransferase family 2 protein [Candidatus Aenigmarchaeota archaeon]